MIRVHWNLHKGGYSVSVKTAEGWRIASNPDAVCLRGVRFVVSAQQLWTLRNVHRKRKVVAWAEGEPCACADHPAPDAATVTFNPWKADTFVSNGAPIDGASHVHFETVTRPDGVRVPLTRVLV